MPKLKPAQIAAESDQIHPHLIAFGDSLTYTKTLLRDRMQATINSPMAGNFNSFSDSPLFDTQESLLHA